MQSKSAFFLILLLIALSGETAYAYIGQKRSITPPRKWNGRRLNRVQLTITLTYEKSDAHSRGGLALEAEVWQKFSAQLSQKSFSPNSI